MSKKKKDWKVEKARLLSLTVEERRKEYYESVTLDKIPTWKKQEKSKGKEEVDEQDVPHLSDKVSLYKGDITILEVDAIVNAGPKRISQSRERNAGLADTLSRGPVGREELGTYPSGAEGVQPGSGWENKQTRSMEEGTPLGMSRTLIYWQ